MKHEDLSLSRCVFSSHDDFNPVCSIYVGYDDGRNLILLLEHTDYDAREFGYAEYAVINKDEGFKLAKRVGVAMRDLPDYLSGLPDDYYFELSTPFPGDVRDCFADMLDCLLALKCRFRTKRVNFKN